MDKLKGVAKGGWHSGGDRPIHRDTWKSDLKGIATGKKNDPYESARNHQSAPLSTLKDPDSFGPPPKHSVYHGAQPRTQTPTQSTAPKPATQGGSGSQTSTSQPRQEEIAQEQTKPSIPYRTDTTGLRTNNLPKPPSRAPTGAATSPASSSSPGLPPRIPPRQAQTQTGPPPVLPPRQNEYPDEHTPAAPPPYEAAQSAKYNAEGINQDAVRRLGQAGIAATGLGIGGSAKQSESPSSARGPDLGELQQRFARLNTQSGAVVSAPTIPTGLAAAAVKKAAPPPPPKKANLSAESPTSDRGSGPPPIPLSSKPKP